MDSLHLFSIPKWLPDKIPSEIWSIIFYWKWRLEIKDIHTELLEKNRYYSTQPELEYCSFSKTEGIHGNCWIKTDYSWGGPAMYLITRPMPRAYY